jgi:arabinan endo-1,5-alpha-L-arabinosidase
MRPLKRLMLGLLATLALGHTALAAVTLTGQTDIHDPSTIHKEGSKYWTFGTGDGIVSRYSSDLKSWTYGNTVFTAGTWPSWINSYVTNFAGNFWAPDVIKMNGKYYLYYSAFATTSSSFESAIGVAVTDSLNNPSWTDLGMVVSTKTEALSSGGFKTNTIDPGLFVDASNKVWMVYGSHYAGIYMVQINPSTGKRMNTTRYPVVGNSGNWHEFEAAQVKYMNGYYYMFVNLGECCAGNQSDYYIVTGRSTSPTGPYLDKNGVDLWNYGGSTLLSTSGTYIGPGHFGYYNHFGQDLASIHYYDGTTSTGWPARLDLLQMSISSGWPTFTRNYSLKTGYGSLATVADGRVALVSKLSGKAIDVSGKSTADGADVIQWSYGGSANQHWDLTHLGNGYYSLRAVHSGKSMEVWQSSTADGGDVRQNSYTGATNQQWQVTSLGNGYYKIVSRLSGKALDVYNMSLADGGDIRQWSYWGGDGQQWELKYVNP